MSGILQLFARVFCITIEWTQLRTPSFLQLEIHPMIPCALYFWVELFARTLIPCLFSLCLRLSFGTEKLMGTCEWQGTSEVSWTFERSFNKESKIIFLFSIYVYVFYNFVANKILQIQCFCVININRLYKILPSQSIWKMNEIPERLEHLIGKSPARPKLDIPKLPPCRK